MSSACAAHRSVCCECKRQVTGVRARARSFACPSRVPDFSPGHRGIHRRGRLRIARGHGVSGYSQPRRPFACLRVGEPPPSLPVSCVRLPPAELPTPHGAHLRDGLLPMPMVAASSVGLRAQPARSCSARLHQSLSVHIQADHVGGVPRARARGAHALRRY